MRCIDVSIHAPGRGATGVTPLSCKPSPSVSIHAPGRGATALRHLAARQHCVSIHAPGRGATPSEVVYVWLCSSFQFTHPGGVRRMRATGDTTQRLGFNSRTREGCDRFWQTLRRLVIEFQFTHPGGVRRFEHKWGARADRFNSRTREGCDPHWERSTASTPCFNSRTREGCDRRLRSTSCVAT